MEVEAGRRKPGKERHKPAASAFCNSAGWRFMLSLYYTNKKEPQQEEPLGTLNFLGILARK